MPSDPRDAALAPDAIAQARARVELMVAWWNEKDMIGDGEDPCIVEQDIPALRLLLAMAADYVSREDRERAADESTSYREACRLLKLEP
jgi:hypothetical protein